MSPAHPTPLRARGGLMGIGSPSPITHGGREPTVLAFHGFGGTPLEVALVIDVARELGLGARAPLLPGHGTHADDLARTTLADWTLGARNALGGVEGPIVAAGLSLGSLLAAELAAAHPERVRALILLANAAWLASPFPTWPLRLVGALKLPDFAFPKFAADIADPEARRSHLTYSTQPVHAALEVLRAGDRVRAELSKVRCPTLIVHGARDRVCPPSNAERVAALLGTRDVRVVVLPRSRHIVTRDLEHSVVTSELRAFLERTL